MAGCSKKSYIESIGFQQFKQLLTETNEKIIRLQSFKQKTVAITSLLGQLAEQVPSDIFFTNFSFQTSFPQSDINAAGFAESRDSLFQFKQDLEEVDGLNNVYFQPSSWVKPMDADFSFRAQYQSH